MKINIRLATPDDHGPILDIYAPIVLDTIISFEYEVPTMDEMRRRITTTLQQYPWLVCEYDGHIAGYAYASQHRTRTAYQWSVDVSAYVREDFRRRQIGKGLYTALLAILSVQGYFNAYAGIALPNPASVRLHESVGFTPIGVYKSVGFKQNAWRDVGWWGCSLQGSDPRPAPPQAIGDISADILQAQAFQAGLVLIQH